MIEFDKWVQNDCLENLGEIGCRIMSCRECERIQAATWKAALEWVLAELEVEEPYEIFLARIKGELEDAT